MAEWKQRSSDWHQQFVGERNKLRQAEIELNAANQREPAVVEKIPDDYESVKRQAAELKTQTDALQKQLADLKKQQDKLINDQVKSKLHGYQDELNEIENKKRIMEEQVDRMKSYMASLDSEAKHIEVHQSVINGTRLELIGLAAFLNDLDPISDQETIKKWLGLAGMCDDASQAIRSVFSGENNA